MFIKVQLTIFQHWSRLSEPMIVSSLTCICVTRPQWIRSLISPANRLFKKNLRMLTIMKRSNHYLIPAPLCGEYTKLTVDSPNRIPVMRKIISMSWCQHACSRLIYLTHWPLRDVSGFHKCVFSNSFHELISCSQPVKLILYECHKTQLIIRGRWFN